MMPHVEIPFPWAPLVASALFVGLAIWSVLARRKG